jgi:tRNA pseudouridine55 synthase
MTLLTVNGFLNLNKPAGWTSHDCVAKVRKLVHQKRVGHGGTLDPAATGVLPIALGRATRLLKYLSPDKAYQATVRFGLTTTTDDLEGDILQDAPCPDLTCDRIQSILPQFLGRIEQIPPKYSAIQVNGQRLYDLARSGQPVEVPTRTVMVHGIDVLDWRSQPYPELDLAITCGPGTYIRAIARDLGNILGTGATLAHLTRTRSCGLSLTDSQTLDDIGTQAKAQTLTVIPPAPLLQHLPGLTLPDETARRWQQGQKVAIASDASAYINSNHPAQPYRIHATTSDFLGISEVVWNGTDCLLRPRLVYHSPPPIPE